MGTYGDAYREARERFGHLMSTAPAGLVTAEVPACPGWQARDVLAHVVAIATDTLAGNIEGAGSVEYTSRQVNERREKSPTELLDEWDVTGPKFEEMLDTIHPAIAGGIIGDLVTHEQDARGAMKMPGGRDGLAFDTALDSHVRFFGRRIKEARLPALEVRVGDRTWTAGKDDVIGKLEGDGFELLRGLTGRRTHDQVRRLHWSVDPGPYLPVFSMYGLPGSDLIE